MTLKQNTEFKKHFDEYIEKHSRKTERNKIKTLMKQIRHGLARGADKKTIFNFFRDEKILTLSYNSFCRYLRELEHENNTQVEHKDHLNVTETTQVSPNKSPQQTPKTTAEATTGTKPEQQTGQAREKTFNEKIEEYFALVIADTTVYPTPRAEFDANIAKFLGEICAKNPREGRKFGAPPKGKDLIDLPQELQDTIKQESDILQRERSAISRALQRKAIQERHRKEAEEKK